MSVVLHGTNALGLATSMMSSDAALLLHALCFLMRSTRDSSNGKNGEWITLCNTKHKACDSQAASADNIDMTGPAHPNGAAL